MLALPIRLDFVVRGDSLEKTAPTNGQFLVLASQISSRNGVFSIVPGSYGRVEYQDVKTFTVRDRVYPAYQADPQQIISIVKPSRTRDMYACTRFSGVLLLLRGINLLQEVIF